MQVQSEFNRSGRIVNNFLPEKFVLFGSSCSFVLTFKQLLTKNYFKMAEAYCVKCKAKRDMKDSKEVVMKNQRKALKGTCPECGTGMFKILGKA